MSDFVKILLVGAELFLAGEKTDGHDNFRNFAGRIYTWYSKYLNITVFTKS